MGSMALPGRTQARTQAEQLAKVWTALHGPPRQDPSAGNLTSKACFTKDILEPDALFPRVAMGPGLPIEASLAQDRDWLLTHATKLPALSLFELLLHHHPSGC